MPSLRRHIFQSNTAHGISSAVSIFKISILTSTIAVSLIPTVATATSHSQQMYDAYQVSYQPIVTNSQGDDVSNYCPQSIDEQTSHPDHVNSIRYNIDCMMTELKRYQTTSSAQHSLIPYYAYKAQAWLNYAYEEDVEGSFSQAGDYALAQGVAILEALRYGVVSELEINTDIPATSALMRPDLWATLMGLKANGAAYITPRELAFAEVKLIWAAAEYCEMGWRHAREHFYASERYLEEATEGFVVAKTDEQNITLQNNIATLFKIYAPLDPKDDTCNGVTLSASSPINKSAATPTTADDLNPSMPLVMPNATATYQL